jgi:DNA-binding transcriptional LysR family regulator
VLENLVVSGVGLPLALEERARLREAAGELYLLEDARLSASLWFVYRTEREHDPAITALIDVFQNVWPPKATGSRTAHSSKRRRVGLAAEKRS